MRTVVEQIFRYGAEHRDKPALLDGKEEITYEALLASILSAREILRRRYGVKKDDRVILAADKQPGFISVYFACHLLGAVTLPIAPDTNAGRYRLIKEKVRPSLLVGFHDGDGGSVSAGWDDFKGDTGGEPVNADPGTVPFPSMEDIADIIFTTGTTGEPKGVLLSQKNIAAAARNINTFIGNTPEDVEMLALPISHSFGLGRMRCALSNGQTLVMLGSFANVRKFFRFMREYRVTGFGMVPAGWALLKKMSGMEIGSYRDQLRYVEIGSAPMPLEEKEALIEVLPDTRICMHYGLTEASRSAFIEFHEEKDKLATVGRPSPNTDISIRDEEGKTVAAGNDGEICVRGDAVTAGYLGLPREGAFYGEYFRTGDWGSKDADGYITLKSRKKELINVGGRKVSPAEVEEVLMSFGFVKDCACTAVPDPEGILGEVVKAYIVTDDKDMVSFERIDLMIGSRLEGYKHPVQYEAIDRIPKTSSGKVQRLLLK